MQSFHSCTKALAEAIASALLCTAQLAGRGKDLACGHARECTRARTHTHRASAALRAFAPALLGWQKGTATQGTAAGAAQPLPWQQEEPSLHQRSSRYANWV